MPRLKKTQAAKIYLCARHNKERRDTRLVSIFLCDDCLKLLKEKALNNKNPECEGSELQGYCGCCLENKKVKQRFIYLCTVCERIIRSYAIEKAATGLILKRWDELNQLVPTGISLVVVDPVEPMTYDVHKRRKENHTSNPDFLGIDKTKNPIFAIEMKTGKNPISKMSAFQLDVSDCDDILAFYGKLRLPTYLFHVEVVSEFYPPTEVFVGRNAWWLNVFEMEKCFKETRMRQREQRPAAYYDKKCFHKLDVFLEHLSSADFKTFEDESKKSIPTLYVLKKKT